MTDLDQLLTVLGPSGAFIDQNAKAAHDATTTARAAGSPSDVVIQFKAVEEQAEALERDFRRMLHHGILDTSTCGRRWADEY